MLYKLAPVIDHVFAHRKAYKRIGVSLTIVSLSLIASSSLSSHAVVMIDQEQLRRASQ